nr:AvrE-family type 3 secretion system effector [Dickeya dadantii]
MKRGLDNQAYVLDEGQLKKLSINQKADSVTHGDNNVFAVTQGRNSPSAGDPLTGLEKNSGTTALAVVMVISSSPPMIRASCNCTSISPACNARRCRPSRYRPPV